ncbi:hypothetical protein A1O1_02980 [Capronia coronata CBS 617.96]|uniref:Endoplasmic reticulum-based factor for assembly of V-ATPase-domain-containing protein n=1 Tax=Capronia coronata CBS 617.96 TaxID=1182541 RepID=W9ZJA8_9EURO|nr:uncharacterized protein A1O1_02980 [Capronia coronata CBS 617.96]EXJ94584.1 hypothetical protein A1O1_02980 [Capronia coronata CBS 617.96]
MVLLVTTPRILDAISSLSSSDRSSLPPLPTTPGAPIEHSAVIALSRLTISQARRYTLNTLLLGTHVYVPPPAPKPQPSPEYVALMDRLRKEQEQRDYAHMVSKRASVYGGVEEGEGEERDDISPSLVLNILLSIVLCAIAMFYLTRWWPNDGLRVLVSLSTGMVVGVAEVTVYAGYLRKVRLSKEKERAKREKKQFIGEYRGEAIPESVLSVPAEKEEIWGRGANGGMRRRVRDKWEKDQDRNIS